MSYRIVFVPLAHFRTPEYEFRTLSGCAVKMYQIWRFVLYNFILEGDNLQSLYLLEKTHKGLIDVIYIDPPYNTGKKDFVYNDRIIAKEDTYRHSKWLSFMAKGLR